MKTLESIQAKIAALQVEADEIRMRERVGVISRIREAIKSYKITPAELRDAPEAPTTEPGRVTTPEQREAMAERMRRRRAVVKYRGPEGQTWSGLGYAPRWLKDWEAKRGRKREQLLVE